jgi:cytoplasmic FMR1 interacting protein
MFYIGNDTQEERNSEDTNINEDDDFGLVQYEQVIKLNFSKDELTVFVDIISMIKSLSSIMGKEEGLVAPYIRFHVHHLIQQFVQGDILPVLHRIDKRKKPILSSILNIRSLAADWLNGIEPREDYKGYSRKHGHLEPKHNPRVVSTSATQLHLLRSSVRCLFQENSEIRQKSSILGKAELEKEDILLFEQFYRDSYFFPYVLNLSGSIREMSSLGEFWFREFFLEVDKSIQFPIEMSFPWILTEHVIKNSSSSDLPMIEKILYILEIYNDAAQSSLYDICQQYLYDEVEAESNLVLDQLIFLMSDEIYTHYKNFAGSTILEKSYKNKLESLKGSTHLSVNKKRYSIPMTQRHMQLLGRSINFSFLIGQHINNKISKDIDIAIKRFESSDMTGIIELNTLINLLRQTHAVVSETLVIDSFDDLLNENNGNFAPTCFRSRISSHMLRTLLVDLFPNFSYNSFTQRFVRSPIQIRPAKYPKPPKTSVIKLTYGSICYKAFEMADKLTKGFFGRPHLEAYVTLTGYADLSMIIEGCFSNLSETLQDIGTYVEALKDGIPPCKLPKYMYRAGGCYAYFEGKLTPILEYDDIKPEVFQNLREVGNTVSFIRDLSEILDVIDQFHFLNLSPFLGITPEHDVSDINATKNSPLNTIFSNLQKNISSKDPDIARLSSETFSSIATINSLPETGFHLISSMKSVNGCRSLFQLLLIKINEIMNYYKFNESWNIDREKEYIEVENSKSFHFLWSAMFFLFNMKNNPVEVDADDDTLNDNDTFVESAFVDQVSDLEEFGHGFAISGSMILHFLKQKDIFEATDFSSFVIKVDDFDKLAESNLNLDAINENSNPSTTSRRNSFGFASEKLKIETEEFIESSKKHLEIMKMFFSLFECQSKSTDRNVSIDSDVVENVENIIYFHPPNE